MNELPCTWPIMNCINHRKLRKSFRVRNREGSLCRQGIRERCRTSQHLSSNIGEGLLSRQRPHLTVDINLYRISEEMALQSREFLGGEPFPVVLGYLVHTPHAGQMFGFLKAILQHPQVLCPQRHSIPINLHIINLNRIVLSAASLLTAITN